MATKVYVLKSEIDIVGTVVHDVYINPEAAIRSVKIPRTKWMRDKSHEGQWFAYHNGEYYYVTEYEVRP